MASTDAISPAIRQRGEPLPPASRGLRARLPQLLEEESGGIGIGLLRGACTLVSIPYGLIVRARSAAYRSGLMSSHRLPRPVICVGNITAGGTGKTPLVEALARRIGERRKVGILIRGYAPGPDGSDEVGLLRANLPGIEVFPGPDRVRMGREALEGNEIDVFILDDGFQHFRLERDLDIVTIDALRPFGFGRLLPRGLLREPITGLRRARVVALTRTNQVEDEEVRSIRSEIERVHPEATIIECGVVSSLARDPDAPEIPASALPLEGETVLAFCGIGNPETFSRSLREMGSASVPIVFPDHHDYSSGDLRFLEEEGKRVGATAWVTTQKDEPKVRRLSPPSPLWTLRLRAEFRSGLEALDEIIEEALVAGRAV
ncbi:MAG: tetraacyldisaccharide 4'-kinase [Planctomycetota bacterium]|nr:tetraacyldisaccharide 4'-kinase [Planctomycetota bacterium]